MTPEAEAHKSLREAFKSGRTKSYKWRVSQLKALQRMLKQNEMEILEAFVSDLGRGHTEGGLAELVPLRSEIAHVLKDLWQWMLPHYTASPFLFAPSTSEIMYEPYGTCLIIGPFNYPLILVLSPLVGAIAAGNCALIKPSEMTPAVERTLKVLIPKYLDSNCIKVVTGGVETTTSLLSLRWDKIFFTGSTRVGKIVAAAGAKFLTPVSLELGGKSPTIIDQHCGDMALVCRRIVWGKQFNAGQTCIAPDYVLCHASRYQEFLKTAAKTLKQFYGEDAQKSKDYARIINVGHVERLKKYLEENAGQVVVGGRVDEADRYVEPTIVGNVQIDSKLMTEEIFGPILPVLKFERLHEAIEIINSDALEKPLAMYIFSTDRSRADEIIRRCPSGAVIVNDTLIHFASTHVPFGGIGNSGLGGYRGFHSFEAFSHKKPVFRRDGHWLFDISARYPPYSRLGECIVSCFSTFPAVPACCGCGFWNQCCCGWCCGGCGEGSVVEEGRALSPMGMEHRGVYGKDLEGLIVDRAGGMGGKPYERL